MEKEEIAAPVLSDFTTNTPSEVSTDARELADDTVRSPEQELAIAYWRRKLSDEDLEDNKLFAEFERDELSPLAASISGSVKIVNSWFEAFSPEAQRKSILNNEFYVCVEDPRLSAKVTRGIIDREIERKELQKEKALPQDAALTTNQPLDLNERNRQLLVKAKVKWVEKAQKNADEVIKSIETIKTNYMASHNGHEPSMHKIAELLNASEVVSPRKGKWYAQTVKRILERTEKPSHRK